jgi:hypothetical protein
MEMLLMGFGAENDRKRLAVLASARTRDGFEAVLPPNPTAGAANSRQIFPPAPPKPDGLLRFSRKNPVCEFARVKSASIYEYSP